MTKTKTTETNVKIGRAAHSALKKFCEKPPRKIMSDVATQYILEGLERESKKK